MKSMIKNRTNLIITLLVLFATSGCLKVNTSLKEKVIVSRTDDHVEAAVGVKKNKLELKGNIRIEGGDRDVSTITVYQGNKEKVKFKTDPKGGFSLKLDYQKDYLVDFTHDGYLTKRIEVSTKVPDGVFSTSSNFPPFPIDVMLNKVEKEDDDAPKLTGKIFFSKKLDNFDAALYRR
ncbi:hypothetical protein EYV94_18595 [Puteibacter caeruleilacunae]|nr:hypothetical protein EYV94_18595 [Puteibacter caeruleilacunae]